MSFSCGLHLKLADYVLIIDFLPGLKLILAECLHQMSQNSDIFPSSHPISLILNKPHNNSIPYSHKINLMAVT